MRVIHKFHINLTTNTVLEIPTNALTVHFAKQHEVLYAWIELSPDDPTTSRTFRIFGTGMPIPEEWAWQGTCFDGPFVWHLYMEEM